MSLLILLKQLLKYSSTISQMSASLKPAILWMMWETSSGDIPSRTFSMYFFFPTSISIMNSTFLLVKELTLRWLFLLLIENQETEPVFTKGLIDFFKDFSSNVYLMRLVWLSKPEGYLLGQDGRGLALKMVDSNSSQSGANSETLGMGSLQYLLCIVCLEADNSGQNVHIFISSSILFNFSRFFLYTYRSCRWWSLSQRGFSQLCTEYSFSESLLRIMYLYSSMSLFRIFKQLISVFQ